MKDIDQEIRAILKTLKATVKDRGYNYAKLAKELGVSEVTIKRLFSGEVISLKNIQSICKVLNVSFLEIASTARETEYSEYIFNEKQDKYFGNHPQHYAIFISLYRRESNTHVKKYWNLSDSRFFKLLRVFEKLNLLEIYPGDRIHFKMAGAIKAPAQGLLRHALFKQNFKFLEHVQSRPASESKVLNISEVLLSPEHAKSILGEFQAITNKLRMQAAIDEKILPRHKKKSFRLLFAYAPYETDWRKL